MSMKESRVVSCRRCGHSQSATLWLTINVSLDKNLKQQLLDGKLNDVTCDKCGNVSLLQYGLLYHDMDIPAAIWLVYQGDDTPELREAKKDFTRMVGSNHKLRIVHSMHELIEKIYIFDAGLNDFAIQLYKSNYFESSEAGVHSPWFFAKISTDQSPQRLVFYSPSSKQFAAIPMPDGYHQLATKFEGVVPHSEWVYVNSEKSWQLYQSTR